MTSSDLQVSVRFLQPYCHARGEDDGPEWPPSPLRLFQALVASGVGREVDSNRRASAVAALRLIEQLPPPEIVAPAATVATAPRRHYVPNNSADRNSKRAEKQVLPLHLHGEAVHYVFRGAPQLDRHLATIQRVARSLTHVGWGIDMVVGDAKIAGERLDGEHWLPGRRGGNVLRLPTAGTFDALEEKHAEFLRRLAGETFRPVSPLGAFATQPYARATDPVPAPFAAYRLLDPITGDPLWLDPVRRARDVAAWTRHAVAQACAGWPYGSIDTIVHGHGASTGPQPRFSYVPLPTINPHLHRVEGIRRVLVMAPSGAERELAWLERRLGGAELEWNGDTVGVLEPLPAGDWVLRQYVEPADEWTTVTPVVLPGHDDRSGRKTEGLIRKALLHAGLSVELVNEIVDLECRRTGFLAGAEHAARYLPPDKIAGPMLHVRVRFARRIAGPIVAGSGRHRGIGVFVALRR